MTNVSLVSVQWATATWRIFWADLPAEEIMGRVKSKPSGGKEEIIREMYRSKLSAMLEKLKQ